jgi:hypothetical protein
MQQLTDHWGGNDRSENFGSMLILIITLQAACNEVCETYKPLHQLFSGILVASLPKIIGICSKLKVEGVDVATTQMNLVEFIGGPFDGFRQHVREAIDDLPGRVSIPVDQRSADLFGLEAVPSRSQRAVVYHLQLSAGLARYCYRKEWQAAGVSSTMSTEAR